MTNLYSLPNELLYLIHDFLTPFDSVNFNNIIYLQYKKNFKKSLEKQIIEFSNGNQTLAYLITNIITSQKEVDTDLLSVFKELILLFKKTNKYMDILGYSFYVISIEQGENSIRTENVFEKNSQIIFITFNDKFKLSFYIEKFLKFTKKDHKNRFVLRNCDVKKNLLI